MRKHSKRSKPFNVVVCTSPSQDKRNICELAIFAMVTPLPPCNQGCGFASLYCGSGSKFFTLVRIRIQIRILLLIKMMQISNPCSTYLPGLHILLLRLHGPPQLHFEPLKLLNIFFIGDPNPAFRHNVDPDQDPPSQNTCGYGSTHSTTPPKWEWSLFGYFIA
jgi:hypothetical protein